MNIEIPLFDKLVVYNKKKIQMFLLNVFYFTCEVKNV